MTNTYRPERRTLHSFPSILRSTLTPKACIRLLLVGLAFPLACFFVSLQTEARTSPAACECNRNAPDTVHVRWTPNTALRVMITRGEFSAPEVAAFQEAIRSWQAVLPASGTGINLQMGGEITGKDCTGCIVVKRKASMGGTFASLSPFTTSGAFYSKAVINIKGDIHKTVLLRMLLTHELGHAFGLDDCEECAGNTTVMNSVNRYAFGAFSFFAPRNKMAAAPTRCDVARVADGYTGASRSLAAYAAATAPSAAPSVRAQDRNQSRSVVANTAVNNAAMRAPAAPSARHHASRIAGQFQRAVKIEQVSLMDALTKRD
ncbi:MAG TPA: hypothetical protein VE842_16205 [Pyrinomonadaceae bacterium]|nr:hypothetical protein [Pyrinomonadaceae bacterium]